MKWSKKIVVIVFSFILNSICFADVVFYNPNEFWGMVQNHRTGDWWDKNVLNEKIILSWIVIAVIIVLLTVALRIWKSKKRMIIFTILSLIFLIGNGCFSFYIYNKAMEYPDQRRSPVSYSTIIYNERFTRFLGDNRPAAEVRSLLINVRIHNDNTYEIEEYGTIKIEGDVISEKDVDDYKRYRVAVAEYSDVGSISKIRITEQESRITE